MENLLLAGRGITGMVKVPDLIRSKGVVRVDRGLVVQEVIVVNSLLEASVRLEFEHDFFFDTTEAVPMYVGMIQSAIPEELNRIATLIECQIMNRSGADDTYSFYLWNSTTDEILWTIEDAAIVNKGFLSWHFAIGVDKISEGDAIYFIIYDGVLGTHQAEPIFGSMSMNMTSLSDARSFGEWMGVEV
ncbi:MAG: hypothetical protein E3J56_01070 [Candidatus Aminicenantes bacterium]|nr:MAG: hypothetical protein E3J56_01070 [Candidatus Aminicenantes bacterium]